MLFSALKMDDSQGEHHYRAGHRLFAEGQYADAAAELQKAVEHGHPAKVSDFALHLDFCISNDVFWISNDEFR